ncbi:MULTISPECIES: acyl carrier protein [Sinorhizobium]|uniref:Acyl carrier protein n=1 Tax=Sinorhizobium mexicanum TaxID=375549 RepID=A0A859QD97_9HYPH|nr:MULTISPECIES: acyl carrier protein [Sinorhizobium]MBP1887963.1 acyl carrier protein [Sinorhizobium mexicanum]MDK1377404.1 acyl carrier protein [Sinorhizobium sp. 6-70]MDK1477645.1 acyl carrier protein [Sinorhizobium sp. 6-117]QLL60074.1 acyl carrier protein [Sinorhizobium mexicanum]
MTETIKDSVKAFIIENFLFGDTSYELADTASLIENDIIDSTGVLELVAFIEDRFGIAMADADIVPANLDSLARISAFIAAKSAVPVSA